MAKYSSSTIVENYEPSMRELILYESLKRADLPDDAFGVPEERKYPLDTKEHVYSAVKLFNHVNPKYEEELANNIKDKINEYDIKDIRPGENNRFSKYYKNESVTESPINTLASFNDVQMIIDNIPKNEHHLFYHGPEFKDVPTAYRSVKKNTDGAGGFIDVYDLDDPGTGIIVIAVEPSARGTGLSAELVKDAINNTPKHIHTLYWRCDKENIASYKLAKKMGFKQDNRETSKDQYVLKYKRFKKSSVCESTLTPVSESFKVNIIKDKDKLKSEAKKLAKSKDDNLSKLGNAILEGIDTGFDNVIGIIGGISGVLVAGVASMAVIAIILSVLVMMVTILPFAILKDLLSKQLKFLHNVAKPTESLKKYYSGVSSILHSEGNIESISLESLDILLEAPKKDTVEIDIDDEDEPNDYDTEDDEPNDYDADGDEDEANDYTDNIDDDTDDNTVDTDEDTTDDDEGTNDANEDTTDDEGVVAMDDTEDEANDYTDAVDDTDDTGNEMNVDSDDTDPTGDNTNDATDDTGEDAEEDEPNDYTDEVDGDGSDTDDADTGDDDVDTNDTTSETDDNESSDNNINIKNYNLLIEFQKLHTSLEGILQHLQTISYETSIQNSVLKRVSTNIETIKDEVMAYLEFNFSNNYRQNLYYFNMYVQLFRITLEMMNKMDELNNGESN